MQSFAVRDLREHTGERVRDAEAGEYSVVSKHGKPLFVAVPFTDALLDAGVHVPLADQMVLRGELSAAAGAKMARQPCAHDLQHLSARGYSVLDGCGGRMGRRPQDLGDPARRRGVSRPQACDIDPQRRRRAGRLAAHGYCVADAVRAALPAAAGE